MGLVTYFFSMLNLAVHAINLIRAAEPNLLIIVLLMKRLFLSMAVLMCAVLYAMAQPSAGYLYEEWRKSAYPALDMAAPTNPVALLWPSEKYWNKKTVTYNVYLSQDKSFNSAATLSSMGQRSCMFNPHQRLASGRWYWKYEIVEQGEITPMGPYSFIVNDGTEGVVTPDAHRFIANIPVGHPRVMNYGRDLNLIRQQAPTHPLYNTIIGNADKYAAQTPYTGPVDDSNPARARRLVQQGNKEVEMYHTLLQGYILSGKEHLFEALMERTDILLTWPTNDLLGSKVLSALSTAYDVLYNHLSAPTRKKIETIVDKQLKKGLARWPGYTETRHIENHFWQMELAGNFTAALAMLGHLDSAREMLEYTYELFIARFPNLSTQDGGWSEGEGYYSVNQTAVVDMALLLKKLGNIDIFKMGWYKNLPDYFTYFSPVASPVSGFGDMHDRVATGSLKGHSEMLMLGCEENNSYALYRLFQSLKPVDSFYGKALPAHYWEKPLSKIEPWYQIVNNIRLKETDGLCPDSMPKDKVFYGIGTAALHTHVLQPQTDETVFFRSSPFGAKGHMHANQNGFNISRKGERIFYSTGYYTSFSNPHSLTSYRHTRAHNCILIDSIGQAFGHEGFGAILRHLEGNTISCLTGDASQAYRPVVDQQFAKFLNENNITAGHGESGLTTFKRHLVFARPGIIVIYDELAANHPAEWSLLLHTLAPAQTTSNSSMRVESQYTTATAHVYGSTHLAGSYTDQYYSPAIDFKKKYPQGTPLAHHFSYVSTTKTPAMRYLTIIRLADKGEKLSEIKHKGNKWTVGQVDIYAEMNTNRPARLIVGNKTEKIEVTDKQSTLTCGNQQTTCTDVAPMGNYAF